MNFRIVLHACVVMAGLAATTPATADELADALRRSSPNVLSAEQRESAVEAMERDIRRRTQEVNQRDRQAWSKIADRREWEEFCRPRLDALRKSLGEFPPPPEKVEVRVGATVQGDGFRIENLVYQSRPGQWVPGNLYVPDPPREKSPVLLVVPAHHTDKTHGELQDMGMTWARAGCLVLVIDQVGYGERRAHPFDGPEDYPVDYRPSRQDYYFRYDSGVQLHLVGESLMGWFVWDWMRAIDWLVQRPDADPRKIIILGSVAGGGDPAAVTAALDPRIAGCVAFNFGGPQPETRHPLPENAEESFNYLGGAYWDGTRNLRRSGADGFLPWVIVGSIAPRPLVYAHEFAWDQDRDPVWRRLERIYGEFYGARDKLGSLHGEGSVRGSAPESTHCTHIGRYHRQFLHPLFREWFGIEVAPEHECSNRLPPEKLRCLTPELRQEFQPKSFLELVREIGENRSVETRQELEGSPIEARREHLRRTWQTLLGDVEPKPLGIRSSVSDDGAIPNVHVERVVLETEPDVLTPVIVLSPGKVSAPGPVVVAVAQQGKEAFLRRRADEIAQLLENGITVVLPDVRGTGEIKRGTGRDRTSGDTNLSVHVLLFDQTLLGQRLRDLKGVLQYVRTRDGEAPAAIALWGDSLVEPNVADANFNIPHGVGGEPRAPEPLGGLLALLSALDDEKIAAVYVNGGLDSFQSALEHPRVLLPHDVAVPGALTAGDVCDLAAALAPRPLRLDGTVDARNRTAAIERLRSLYEPALAGYRSEGASERLSFGDETTSASEWLRDLALSK
jgi:dienelactone hydrolase